MNEWNRFLKKDGFIAVTEASWFTPERPAEIEDFWLANYPEIDTIPTKIAQMEKAGYTLTAAAADLIAGQRHEQSLYDKYKEYYGYVFYIGQKR